MNDKSKSVWTIVLNVIKYAIVAALGFIGGDSDVIDSLL